MTDDRDTPRPRRRLQLSRETLRDLTPEAADAAGVQGGATVTDLKCRPLHQSAPLRFTGAIPAPSDLLDVHRTTAVLFRDGQIPPGSYHVEQRIKTDFQVLENGEIVIASTQVQDLEPKARE
jgi:hypothetical protein